MRRAGIVWVVLVGALVGSSEGVADEAAGAVTRGPWERVKDEHGIVVERRPVSDSALHEFRAAGFIDAPLEHVFAVIRDADRRTEWMENCVESRFVERGEEFQILYNRTRTPWPAWHRDVVIRGSIRFEPADKAMLVLFEETTHPAEPPKEGVVRMPFLHGFWRLEPRDGNTRTWADYQVHANPGGNLPAWITNHFSSGIPFRTFEKLRTQVANTSYPEYEAAFRQRPGYVALMEAVGVAAPAPTPPAPAPSSK